MKITLELQTESDNGVAGKFGTNVPNIDWCNIIGETYDMHVEVSIAGTVYA